MVVDEASAAGSLPIFLFKNEHVRAQAEVVYSRVNRNRSKPTRPKNSLKDAYSALSCDDANRNRFRKEKTTGLGGAQSTNDGARRSLHTDVARDDVCLTAKIDRSGRHQSRFQKS